MLELVDRVGLATELLSVSEMMLAAYAEDRLEELPALQADRQKLIVDIFDNLQPGQLGDLRWVKIIEKVQTINDQLVILVTKKRDRLAEELNSIRQARKADSAYAQTLLDERY